MAQWTDYWRIVKPQQAKDTYVATDTYNAGGGGAFDNFSWYTQLMQGAGSRLQDYNQYEGMDGDVFVSRALDTIAEEMTNLDEKTNLPFEIAYQNDDNKEVDETIVMTVKAAIRHWADTQDFNNRIFRISRMTVKYGDCFFRKVRDHKAWRYIPPRDVSGIEVDEFGDVVAYHVKNHDGVMGQSQEETVERVEAHAMVHFTLSDSMGESAPFGESILKPSVRAYKQMGLLEDASVIYLTVRAPERKVFYVDVGNMPPHKVKSYLESVKNEIKQKRIPNNTGGQDDIDSVYNPTSMTEDYFFGSTANGRGSRVETLPGGTGLGEGDSLKYFQEKVFMGLRVPMSYMRGSAEGGAQYNDGKVGIAYIEEMRFANFVKRLQAKIERVLDIEFKEYLKKSGINIDDDLFKIQLPEPQNFALYRQAALDSELINTFNSAEGIKYLSKRFILKRYLGFTEDDIQTNEALLRQERKIGDDETDLQRFYDPAYYENVEAPTFDEEGDEGDIEGDEMASDDASSEDGAKPKRPDGGGPGAGLTDLEL